MKKIFALLLCALLAVSMIAPAVAAAPTDADAKLIESLGKKAADYVAVDWFAEVNAYYNSNDSANPGLVNNKSNSTASNLANFIVSKTYTKKQLPVGSIIIVDAGYQYRPEGWEKADMSADSIARPGNVTTNVVEVTEAWWDKFTVRAFNLSTTPTRAIVEADKAALRIYVPASALEDNAYANDFEAVPVGAIGKLDGSSVNAVKKEGVIEVVKFDGDNAIRVYHKDTGNSHDPYVNFVESSAGVSTYGLGKQFVIDYEVYFESTCKDMKFQAGMARVAAADGNKFQHTTIIKGEDLGVYIDGETEPVAKLELKKWYTLSAAFDFEKKCSSFYIDGVCVAKDIPFSDAVAAATGETNLIRTAFQGWKDGESVAYIDNVKVYNASQPRVVKEAPKAAETTKPAGTTPAPTTFDAGIIVAAVAAVSLAGTVVLKKKR